MDIRNHPVFAALSPEARETIARNAQPPAVPFYGNPINTPAEHKWSGYRCSCGRPIKLPSLASFCVECDDI